MGNTIKLSDQE